MERGNVDQVDPVAPRGQPAGMTAWPTPNVEDCGRSRRQEAGQQLAEAFAIQLPRALMQPGGLVAGSIVGRDRFGLRRMGVSTTGHAMFPPMSAFCGDYSV